MLINLLPYRAYRSQQRRKRLTISYCVIAVSLSLLTFFSYHHLQQAIHHNQQRILSYQQLDKKLQQQQAHHQCQIKHSVLSQQSELEQRFKQQHCLSQLLPQVTQLLPAGITLTRLAQQSDQLTILGHSPTAQPVHQWINKLNHLTPLENCTLASINHAGDSNQFTFELHSKITCLDKTS